MPIFKALELCTNQMLSTDAQILSGYSVDEKGRQRPVLVGDDGETVRGNLIVDPIGDYGWTINLGQLQSRADGEAADFVQALVEEGFSEHFIQALQTAADQDFDAIRFDRDVIPEPGFPEFDWENDDAMEVSGGGALTM